MSAISFALDRAFRARSTAFKLGLLTALALACCVTLQALSLHGTWQMLVEQKRSSVRQVVETAHSLIDHYVQLEQEGALSRPQAQVQALAALKRLRYGNGDYFWINDEAAQVVMHPLKPELDGTDMSTAEDPDGFRMFAAFAETAKGGRSGYVEYRWPKPGFEEPVPKVSFVRGIDRWGWVVGSGVYVDDIHAAFRTLLLRAAFELMLIVAVLCGGSWMCSRWIARRLQLAERTADTIAAGHFDQQLDIDGADETARVLQALARMREQVRRVTRAQLELQRRHEAGETSYRVGTDGLEGEFAELARKSNALVDTHLGVQDEVLSVISSYARGDFARDIADLPGERARISAAMRGVKHNLSGLKRQIADLVGAAARGDFSVRGDADAFEHDFREIVVSLNQLMDTANQGLADLGLVLSALADGDLGVSVDRQHAGSFGELVRNANRTTGQLADIVRGIRGGAEAIRTASAEIAAGSADLSARTEQQAASLEQTASSMEELSATVRQNADTAALANDKGSAAAEVARSGGAIVGELVATMRAISESSRRIGDIIGVIDGIAFQTNILALNASVEAARAGEQGRGFAVVAGEVRTLAQRSASAAREIKAMIDESLTRVDSGAAQASNAGRTMDDIVAAVIDVTGLIERIAQASAEQSGGIEQMRTAVTHLDGMTQQNAAMVEQSSSAARSLQAQADALVQEVDAFRLAATDGAPPLALAG